MLLGSETNNAYGSADYLQRIRRQIRGAANATDRNLRGGLEIRSLVGVTRESSKLALSHSRLSRNGPVENCRTLRQKHRANMAADPHLTFQLGEQCAFVLLPDGNSQLWSSPCFLSEGEPI
jgi:hypothetical protein